MGERLQIQKSYVCSFFDCKATFSKSWKLEAHLCKHTGLKPFSCENCDKSFCTRYQLTRHKLSHSGEKPHKCLADGCPEAFITNASMKNHMARVHHHQEKRYQCDHLGCGKDFNKKKKLKIHKYDHQPHLSFHGCAKEFPSHTKLKHHEKVHKGYPCETEACPFQGRTWTEHLSHRKEHKEKLPCDACKKQFSNTWFLCQHKLHVHSGEKRMFSCPWKGCENTFTRRFNLESHVLGDHEDKKPYRCAYAGCGKNFAMKESLWRHGVVHDPAKGKRKNQLWRAAQQVRAAAAVSQVDPNKLAAKLHNTTLNENKC